MEFTKKTTGRLDNKYLKLHISVHVFMSVIVWTYYKSISPVTKGSEANFFCGLASAIIKTKDFIESLVIVLQDSGGKRGGKGGRGGGGV